MKKDHYKIYTSEAGFNYDLHISSLNNEILIFRKDRGFAFPINNGKIDWNKYKENAVLLSDDVIKAADDFVKYCHLLVFS